MHESKVDGLVVSARNAVGFWSKVDKNGPIAPGMTTPCWLYRGSISADGYGNVSLAIEGAFLSSGRAKKKLVRAHRLAWFLGKGEWPAEFNESGEKLILLHACDVRNCVNYAEHLSLGTHAENSADMAAKGRSPCGEDHYARREPARLARGGAVGTAKLTDEIVAVIKGEIEAAPKSVKTGKPYRGVYSRLAEHFGVTSTMIMYIANGAWWGHVAAAKIEKSVLPARVNNCHSNAKITREQAIEIHKLHGQGMTGVQLAAKFGVSEPTISTVLTGRHWPDAVVPVEFNPVSPLHADARPRGELHPNAKLTEAIVREIRIRKRTGEPRVNIAIEYAERLGVSTKVVFDVMRGTTWKHVKDDVPILE